MNYYPLRTLLFRPNVEACSCISRLRKPQIYVFITWSGKATQACNHDRNLENNWNIGEGPGGSAGDKTNAPIDDHPSIMLCNIPRQTEDFHVGYSKERAFINREAQSCLAYLRRIPW